MVMVPMARATVMAGERKEREDPGDEINPRGHHGGGMQQGADRSGTFHGVGQPDVNGELGALAHDAAEYEQGGGGDEPGGHGFGHGRGIHLMISRLP